MEFVVYSLIIMIILLIVRNIDKIYGFFGDHSDFFVMISAILGAVWMIGVICGCSAIEVFLFPFGVFLLSAMIVHITH